jgi:hypothetical protein
MVTEEFLRIAKPFREQAPETFAAHFTAVAIKSSDGTFRMFVRRAIDWSIDSQPITHGGDLAERDAGLRHAERAGIHSEKEDALRIASITPEIHFVGAPRITERVVNVRDRGGEGEPVDGVAQPASSGN